MRLENQDIRDWHLDTLRALIPRANLLRDLLGQSPARHWLEAFLTLHTCRQLPADIHKALSPLHWLSLLRNYPEFAEGLEANRLYLPPWSKFDRVDWYSLLYAQPQLAGKMPPQMQLTRGAMFDLRTKHPGIQLPPT